MTRESRTRLLKRVAADPSTRGRAIIVADDHVLLEDGTWAAFDHVLRVGHRVRVCPCAAAYRVARQYRRLRPTVLRVTR